MAKNPNFAAKDVQPMIAVLYKDKSYIANSFEATNVFGDCLYFFRCGPMSRAKYKVYMKKGHKIVK